MKTLKQIADELKIDKQKVYRYVKKNHISEAHQKNGVMYYDEVVESSIKQAFSKKELYQESASSDVVLEALLKQYETLKKELDIKNEQIKEKDRQLAEKDKQLHTVHELLSENQKLLDQQQQLHAIAEQKLLQIETEKQNQQPEEKETFWAPALA